jgi:hypothetical protein
LRAVRESAITRISGKREFLPAATKEVYWKMENQDKEFADDSANSGRHDPDGGRSKSITIIVNGREKTVTQDELTFDEVVKLAFDNPPYGPNTLFTITYRKGGNEHRPEGHLVEGETVKVKKGTIFNVTATDKS